METDVLKAEGSSTVYPISNTASSYWNSNAPAGDEDYWQPSNWGVETDKNLADYYGGLFGYEGTGQAASPPFPVTVGLSHSGTGLESVRDGLVDIGNASAPVEAELGEEAPLDQFVDHVVARDGQPIVVSKAIQEAGVTVLTQQEVAGIYRGEITNWSEIESYSGEDKEIYVVGRSVDSGTATAFRSNVLGDPNAETQVDTRKGQNQQAVQVVSDADNAISYLALAFVDEETAPAVAYTSEDGTTYELGGDPGLGASDYPLNRDLHMYTFDGETSVQESAFIALALSKQGQATFVEANNYFPLPSEEIQAELDKLSGGPSDTSAFDV
jgi:phosphate transport system substrate-binding protein